MWLPRFFFRCCRQQVTESRFLASETRVRIPADTSATVDVCLVIGHAAHWRQFAQRFPSLCLAATGFVPETVFFEEVVYAREISPAGNHRDFLPVLS